MATYTPNTSTIFWNVDTQHDFMRPDGKLYVQGAEGIEQNLERITALAKERGIKVINTADWHTLESEEISDTPDYISTFPPHCIKDTPGAAYVPSIAPKAAYTIDWDADAIDPEAVRGSRNIVLRKDKFDAFHPTGAPHTEAVLALLKPERAFVYGVATNVCDDYAVMGLRRHGVDVYVIEDAIKELPNIPVGPVYEKWRGAGVKFTTTGKLEELLGQYR